jgi:hypothetical protein
MAGKRKPGDIQARTYANPQAIKNGFWLKIEDFFGAVNRF